MDYCWVKTEFLELTYDVSSVVQIRTLLPYTEFYWAPRNVRASRLGDEVMVNWDLIPMSLDDNRGYLIEGWLCRDGQLLFTPLQFWAPPAILTDEPGCMEPSHARIYTAEKHGYSEWVAIAWPPHPTPTPYHDIFSLHRIPQYGLRVRDTSRQTRHQLTRTQRGSSPIRSFPKSAPVRSPSCCS